mmetsp:Transcript_20915/g.52532  ORF Transcript_20915/g.52532 Transcript_20915/m.52532 type:complete len:83 (+) Transcript_20915:852-1100(+)
MGGGYETIYRGKEGTHNGKEETARKELTMARKKITRAQRQEKYNHLQAKKGDKEREESKGKEQKTALRGCRDEYLPSTRYSI